MKSSSPNKKAPASVVRSLQVHRCRFADLLPSAIIALAFSPNRERLAVSREDGDIEIWDVRTEHGWRCERKMIGSGQPIAQCLVWVNDALSGPRLFSSGLNSKLFEWNLDLLAPKYISDSYGGAAWCCTVDESEQYLALGCEDGTLRIFDVSDPLAPPMYSRSLSKHDKRVVSVSWRHGVLASGGADSTIRLWDFANGRGLSHIAVESFGEELTIVWSVKVLSPQSLVSGDSLGHVQFWDIKFGTLTATFSAHKYDVLCLVTALNDSVVYAAGLDSLVVEIRRVSQEGSEKWLVTATQRAHTHDIRALATIPVMRKQRSGARRKSPSALPELSTELVEDALVVSGGVDTQMVCYFSNSFRSYPEKIYPFPHTPPVSVSKSPGYNWFHFHFLTSYWILASAASLASSAVSIAPTPVRFLSFSRQIMQVVQLHPTHLPSQAYLNCDDQIWQLGSLSAEASTSLKSGRNPPDKVTLNWKCTRLISVEK
jgi:U3 small nucleolar RNA-associated protein 4